MIALTTAHLADISIVVNIALFVFIIARTPHADRAAYNVRQRLDQRQADPYPRDVVDTLRVYRNHGDWVAACLPPALGGMDPITRAGLTGDVGQVDATTVEQMFEQRKATHVPGT